MDASQASFLEIARRVAQQSNDTRTKVGAVIVNVNNEIIGKGYNCMPKGQDDKFPWNADEGEVNPTYQIRETKYLYVCHAELNAVVNAYKSGADLQGSTIYVTLNPCNECAKLIAQAGIKEVFYIDKRDDNIFKAARRMFDTIGVKHTQI